MARKLLVIGSGVAGLTAALDADAAGFEVTLLAKGQLSQSNTRFAQGGIAVVFSDDDTVREHIQDTMAAGAGLSDANTVEILCSEGPDAVRALMARGVTFDMRDGVLSQGLEAAHSHARILHAGGDATGAGIAFGLLETLKSSSVTVRENAMVVDVMVNDGYATGVRLLDGEELHADAVLLATGGAGQLFPRTTNPAVATADGVAMGLRAGAIAADLEFYQFHPTSLAAPGSFLISEAVRGEGAVLLDVDGNRFMREVHPDAELAPRDVVARGIAQQMARQGGKQVRLDATALGAEFLAKRFPTIDEACRERGFNWSEEPIPVTPAAHYFMGGLRTDPWGRTSVPGLYAIGEVACNGLHGANRLASNSLLEGAVYGRRVVRALVDEPNDETDNEAFNGDWATPGELARLSDAGPGEPCTRTDIERIMWEAAGVSRNEDSLVAAEAQLRQWQSPGSTDVKSAEDANLLLVARALVESALARTESRGAHYRTDFPELDENQAVHSGLVLAGE